MNKMVDFVTLWIGIIFSFIAGLNIYWYSKGYGGSLYPPNLITKNPSKGLRRELLIRTILVLVAAILVLASAYKN